MPNENEGLERNKAFQLIKAEGVWNFGISYAKKMPIRIYLGWDAPHALWGYIPK